MRKEYRLTLESENLAVFFHAYDHIDYAIDDASDEYGYAVQISFEEIDE